MDNFVNRLEFILHNYDYTASSFADKIGVQRSSLSHLLSGRNKPSLDFILKINDAFSELSLEWLLKGTGNYLEKDNTTTITKIIQTPPSPPVGNPYSNDLFSTDDTVVNSPKKKEENEHFHTEIKREIQEEKEEKEMEQHFSNFPFGSNKGDIEQVVIFYKDGTFSQFKPR
ncbi:helix-turn-helix domain-containing protein [Myroides sp. M-43]|uniref:helix-turn-helix transcriptional regulator n=1 Tax=Myroides oncorhynchi TaxID=2893756 RepID=UPI001E65D9E6|nr:helix-turn-helix transcriptional regulator [Myroides oncorhynchi]MCC9043770.1 helix-turn-helix domain-containing protein [Myroides oncorhynchi]